MYNPEFQLFAPSIWFGYYRQILTLIPDDPFTSIHEHLLDLVTNSTCELSLMLSKQDWLPTAANMLYNIAQYTDDT